MPNKTTPRGKSAQASSTESVTLSVLAERVNRRLADKSLDDNKIKHVINSFFDTVRRDILDNGSFKLLGFGTFDRMLVDEKERTDRGTGETIFTPGYYKIKFVPVSALAKRVNKPYEHLQPEVIEEAPVEEEAKPEPDEAPIDPAVEALRDAFDEIDDFDVDQRQTDEPSFDFSSESPNTAAPQIADMSRISVPPAYDNAQTLPNRGGGIDAMPAVENQTVRHAVIQQQIIEQQIVQQHVIQNRHTDELPKTEDDIYDFDYDGDGYEEGRRYISRCWFFAGVAVVLTALMIAALVYVLTHRTPKDAAKAVAAEPEVVIVEPKVVVEQPSAPQIASLQIAADDNLYAALAQAEYGERNLWPYIFSANMLRYPDPDNPGAARELVVPSKPDKAIDRRDIELAVIDVYDSYRSLIAANPRGRAAAIRREHAVISLICGESLYGGFIDKYAIRLDAEDVSAAREQIKNAAR